MYELWPFQQDATMASVSFLRRHGGGVIGQHGVVVLPTGSGKSLVIANTVSQLDAPAVIFQPSKEILEQNITKLAAYGYDPAVFSASFNRREVGDITLATIGSVAKSADAFKDVRYAIIDECHTVNAETGRYLDFLTALGNIRVLGFTATPFRLSTDAAGSQLKFLTRTRPKVFGEMVHYEQIGELMDQGYLCKPDYQLVPGFSRALLKDKGSDYDEAELRRYYNETNFDDRLLRTVKRLFAIGRTRVMVFAASVEQASWLAQQLGSRARMLSADTPMKEREQTVSGFRSGGFWCVSTVGVLSTGFDYPELDTVVCARPTKSLSVYYQQVGRLMRRFPGKDPWLVDMVDHVGMFGKVEDLVLQAGGKNGQLWEFASKSSGKVLTNTYFAMRDGASRNRSEFFRRRALQKRFG